MNGLQPSTPNRLFVEVAKGGITVDNRAPQSLVRTQVWAQAGSTVTFVIENRDDVDHTVTIPLSAAIPSTRYTNRATAVPPVRPGPQTVTIGAGQTEQITMNIQPASHFQFATRSPWNTNPSWGMTYKYDIITEPKGRSRVVLDPDIEIRP